MVYSILLIICISAVYSAGNELGVNGRGWDLSEVTHHYSLPQFIMTLSIFKMIDKKGSHVCGI